MTKKHSMETTIEPVPAGIDPMAFLKQQMDDCPPCRDARTRGEAPEIHVGEPVVARRISAPTKPFPQRPRWRNMKRRTG